MVCLYPTLDPSTILPFIYSMCFVLFKVVFAGCCKYLLYQVCTCSTVRSASAAPFARFKEVYSRTVER